MSAHTPGPYVAFNVCVNQRMKGFEVATVAKVDHANHPLLLAIAVDQPTADLFAAAPDLLDAIQAALDEFAIGNFNAARRQRVVEFIRAAQRKARGGK